MYGQKIVGGMLHQNYTNKDFRGDVQNFAITQAADGIIFVANAQGVLEYDGANWHTIPPNNMLALHTTAEGHIYVGGIANFGVFRKIVMAQVQF